MGKWILGLAASLAAGLAWMARSFFAARTEERLTKERDTALADAKLQSIKAEARAKEAEVRHEQQKREDMIHAADSGNLSSRLDNMFK